MAMANSEAVIDLGLAFFTPSEVAAMLETNTAPDVHAVPLDAAETQAGAISLDHLQVLKDPVRDCARVVLILGLLRAVITYVAILAAYTSLGQQSQPIDLCLECSIIPTGWPRMGFIRR